LIGRRRGPHGNGEAKQSRAKDGKADKRGRSPGSPEGTLRKLGGLGCHNRAFTCPAARVKRVLMWKRDGVMAHNFIERTKLAKVECNVEM
jgi:hypothetical protein